MPRPFQAGDLVYCVADPPRAAQKLHVGRVYEVAELLASGLVSLHVGSRRVMGDAALFIYPYDSSLFLPTGFRRLDVDIPEIRVAYSCRKDSLVAPGVVFQAGSTTDQWLLFDYDSHHVYDSLEEAIRLSLRVPIAVSLPDSWVTTMTLWDHLREDAS